MKRLIIILLFLGVTIVACSNEGNESSTDNPEETEDHSQTVEEEDNKSNEQVTEENAVEENEDLDSEESVEPQYKIDDDWSVVPIEEGTNNKVVLLTIDDAPDKYALDMAKTLKQLDAGAIFFVNGHFIDTEEEKESLKKIHEMGFVIGNHTYNHPLLSEIPEEKQEEELVQLNNVVEEVIGERPKFFRAPNGVNTDHTNSVALREGMVVMNWTYGYDYFQPYMDSKKLATAMITGEGPEVDVPYSLLKPGANLLMHDREWTNEALEEIIIGLREQGYEILDPKLIQTIN